MSDEAAGKVIVRTITHSGKVEIASERDARTKAESMVETRTMMLHTIMYVDGSGSISRYTRHGDEIGWKLAAQEHFSPDMVLSK